MAQTRTRWPAQVPERRGDRPGAVQVLLGHASIATTERYCAVDDAEIRAAMEAAGTG
jgi:site-specific recombinase XerD